MQHGADMGLHMFHSFADRVCALRNLGEPR
jgi:hypothetical protein